MLLSVYPPGPCTYQEQTNDQSGVCSATDSCFCQARCRRAAEMLMQRGLSQHLCTNLHIQKCFSWTRRGGVRTVASVCL